MQRTSYFYPKTLKRRYFIDGKRVSQAQWQESEILAQIKGLKYNSSWTRERKDGVQVSGHCFN